MTDYEINKKLNYYKEMLDSMRNIQTEDGKPHGKEGDRNGAMVARQVYRVIPNKKMADKFLTKVLAAYENNLPYKPNAWNWAHIINGRVLGDILNFDTRGIAFISYIKHIIQGEYSDEKAESLAQENKWVFKMDKGIKEVEKALKEVEDAFNQANENERKREELVRLQEERRQEKLHETFEAMKTNVVSGKVKELNVQLEEMDTDFLNGYIMYSNETQGGIFQKMVPRIVYLLLLAVDAPQVSHGKICENTLVEMAKRGIELNDEEFLTCWITATRQKHLVGYNPIEGKYYYRRIPSIDVLIKAYPDRVEQFAWTEEMKILWQKLSFRKFILKPMDINDFETVNLKWILHPLDKDFVLGPGYKCYLRYWRWKNGNKLLEKGICKK